MESKFKIVSGGQTGADRAALDWAIKNGIAHGGWCPKGRLAEDGKIPAIYKLKETDSDEYNVRTIRNVVDSDATVIFTIKDRLGGGTRLTAAIAKQKNKPLLILRRSDGIKVAVRKLDEFLAKYNPAVLNIAGPRKSRQPEVEEFTKSVLDKSKWLNNKKAKIS